MKGGAQVNSAIYHLIPTDLRLEPEESFQNTLLSHLPDEKPILDTTLPTLLLCECVLAYVSPQASAAIFEWFSEKIAKSAPLGAIVYEMFGLEDSFGRVMKSNLKVCLHLHIRTGH